MSHALKSAFFRYRKTGLVLYVLIFSVVMAMGVILYACVNELSIYIFARPRFFDNSIISHFILNLVFVDPFLSAVLCMIFTGSDISSRAVNNKITTGISRTSIYFADLIFNVISTVLSLIICLVVFILYAKFVPVRANIMPDAKLIKLFLSVSVICLAFTAVFTLIHFFFSNKFFGIIVSLLLLPCMIIGTANIREALNYPYRYSYKDEVTGEMKWELNQHYVGGTGRKVLTAVYEASPYSEYFFDEQSSDYPVIGAGAAIGISTALGYLTVSRKEYS